MFNNKKFDRIIRILNLVLDNLTVMNERIVLLNDKIEMLRSDLEQIVLDKGRKVDNKDN